MIYIALFVLLFIVPCTFGYAFKSYSFYWAGLGAVILLTQRHRLHVDLRTPLERPILCLLAWWIIITPFCPNWRLGVVGSFNDYSNGIAAALVYTVIFYVIAMRDELDEDVVLKLLAWAGAGSAIIGLMQFALSPAWLPEGRAVGTIGGPPFFGCYMAMVLPAALISRQYASATAIVLALIVSGSRGAWAAGIVGVALALRDSNGWARLRATLTVGALGAAIGSYHMANLRPLSDAGRFEAWKGAIAMWKMSPIGGWGPGSYNVWAKAIGPNQIYSRAHNDVLEILATTGAVGLILYAWLWIVLLRKAWSASSPAARAAAGGLAAFFVSIKFNPTCIETATVAAVLAGLLFREHWQERGLA